LIVKDGDLTPHDTSNIEAAGSRAPEGPRGIAFAPLVAHHQDAVAVHH